MTARHGAGRRGRRLARLVGRSSARARARPAAGAARHLRARDAARAALPRRRQPRAGGAVGDAGLHRRARPGAGHHRPADRSLGRRHRRHERLRLRRMARRPTRTASMRRRVPDRLRGRAWRWGPAMRCWCRSFASRRSSRRSARSRSIAARCIVYAGGRADLGDRAARQLRGHRRRSHIAGVPLLVWLALLHHARSSAASRATPASGRNLYALGSNPESARFVGISEGAQLAFVFILSGLLCGLVGVLWGARFGTVDAVIAPRTAPPDDLGGGHRRRQHLRRQRLGLRRGDRRGDLRRAAERRAAPRHQPVLAEAVVGAAILVTVIFYSLLARRAERVQRESRRRRRGRRPPPCRRTEARR